ncbi:MAG: endonuclease/exonuclease/phosphatase family protein [Myxococcaceae bacterium]|nr:endonuclease/exonuclease/phosphatase family protein [Myxococcaceae bacterium]
MAANLTSGNFQSYDPGHGIRIIQGLKADVVMLQEMNYGDDSPAAMEAFMTRLDAGYFWSRGTGTIPNGVLSKYPIADAGEWPDPYTGTRGFAWALIDLPGPRDLFVVSVHLLTANPTTRNNEAISIINRLDTNVAPHELLVIGGDYNTDTWDEPVFVTLSARIVTDAGFPPPTDQNGNDGTSGNRSKPYDHVQVSACLLNMQLDAGIVFDSRVYTPLSDVPPIEYGDSEAPNMQHMAVVKDFVIRP